MANFILNLVMSRAPATRPDVLLSTSSAWQRSILSLLLRYPHVRSVLRSSIVRRRKRFTLLLIESRNICDTRGVTRGQISGGLPSHVGLGVAPNGVSPSAERA